MQARPANSEVPLFRLSTVLSVTDSQGSSSRSGQVAFLLIHTCTHLHGGPQEAVQVVAEPARSIAPLAHFT